MNGCVGSVKYKKIYLGLFRSNSYIFWGILELEDILLVNVFVDKCLKGRVV